MAESSKYGVGVGFLLAGVAVGAIAGMRRGSAVVDSAAIKDLKKSVTELQARVETQEAANSARLGNVEVRLEEQEAKLAAIPSTAQIVSAMERLLQSTMSSLDQRLTAQANSIEVLKSTVTQTDSLLERVLESLDSLQASPDAPADSSLKQQPVI